MAKITKSIVLEQEEIDFLQENFKNVSNGVSECVHLIKSLNGSDPLKLKTEREALKNIRRYTLNELKGVFSSAEWSFLADTLNGTIADGSFRVMKYTIIAHNEDSAEMYNSDEKWGISLSALNEKCEKLTAAQVEAVYFRIEEFWNKPDADLEEWANW